MKIITEIKMLVLEKDITLTKLAEEMSKKLNKKYTLNNLSSKLRKETITFSEIKLIAEILNYEIIFQTK